MLKKQLIKKPKLKDLVKKLKGKKEIYVSTRKTWFSNAMDELDKQEK